MSAFDPKRTFSTALRQSNTGRKSAEYPLGHRRMPFSDGNYGVLRPRNRGNHASACTYDSNDNGRGDDLSNCARRYGRCGRRSGVRACSCRSCGRSCRWGGRRGFRQAVLGSPDQPRRMLGRQLLSTPLLASSSVISSLKRTPRLIFAAANRSPALQTLVRRSCTMASHSCRA
jgi:hypothetical protein